MTLFLPRGCYILSCHLLTNSFTRPFMYYLHIVVLLHIIAGRFIESVDMNTATRLFRRRTGAVEPAVLENWILKNEEEAVKQRLLQPPNTHMVVAQSRQRRVEESNVRDQQEDAIQRVFDISMQKVLQLRQAEAEAVAVQQQQQQLESELEERRKDEETAAAAAMQAAKQQQEEALSRSLARAKAHEEVASIASIATARVLGPLGLAQANDPSPHSRPDPRGLPREMKEETEREVGERSATQAQLLQHQHQLLEPVTAVAQQGVTSSSTIIATTAAASDQEQETADYPNETKVLGRSGGSSPVAARKGGSEPSASSPSGSSQWIAMQYSRRTVPWWARSAHPNPDPDHPAAASTSSAPLSDPLPPPTANTAEALASAMGGISLLSSFSAAGGTVTTSLFPVRPDNIFLLSRSVRVFVSSTASDSKLERNVLQQKILPDLRALVRHYGLTVDLVDMRWGHPNNTSAPADGTLLPLSYSLDDQSAWTTHSRELTRCFRESTGLFFLSLQFDKYGEVTLPKTIGKANFEARLREYSSMVSFVRGGLDPEGEREARKLCQAAADWYKLDITTGPLPVYVLKNPAPMSPEVLAAIQQATASASAKDKVQGLDLEAESEEARYYRDVVPQLHEVLRDVVLDDATAGAIDDDAETVSSSLAVVAAGGHVGCCLVCRSVVEHEIKTALAMAEAKNAVTLARATEATGGTGDRGGRHTLSTSLQQLPDTTDAGHNPGIIAGKQSPGRGVGSKKKLTVTTTSSSKSAADHLTSFPATSSPSSPSSSSSLNQIQWLHRKFDNVFRRDREEKQDLFDGECMY